MSPLLPLALLWLWTKSRDSHAAESHPAPSVHTEHAEAPHAEAHPAPPPTVTPISKPADVPPPPKPVAAPAKPTEAKEPTPSPAAATKPPAAGTPAATAPPPWPANKPADLPPFPGAGWVFDNPPPKAVQNRASAILNTLWKQGEKAHVTEQTEGRWITYQAVKLKPSGKKSVVAYRLK